MLHTKIKVPERITRLGIWPGKYPAAVFLVALLASFVAAPFQETSEHEQLIEFVRTAVVLLFAVLTMGGNRGHLVLGICLAIPPIAAHSAEQLWPDDVLDWLAPSLGVVFIFYVTSRLVRFVLLSRQVTSEVLCAAVSAYLMLGLMWAAAYAALGYANPNAFVIQPNSGDMRGFTALYFSFITLTTCGYGDISPRSGPARMLAMLEAIVGVFYLAIMIARLVALYPSRSQEKSA